MGTAQAPAPVPGNDDAKNQILKRYDERLKYYWDASQSNKNSYKTTRYLLILLGALVTLVASLSSADFIKNSPFAIVFSVGTPLLAASMAIVSGVTQAFQWGAAWSDMVITATRLERERDRISVTPANQLDPVKEMALLDDTVLTETQGFFQRLSGSGGGPAKSDTKPPTG
jgi:hypothetical protein